MPCAVNSIVGAVSNPGKMLQRHRQCDIMLQCEFENKN